MRRVVFIFTLLAAVVVAAERLPLERYQSIIDRQMFGEPPPGFDPTRPPSEVTKAEQRELSKEQEKLQSSISFSVINVTPQGDTMVGFSDNSEKPPKHYYLKVGEENGGWLVKEADPIGGTMTIQKDNIEVSLTIGGNSANDPNANSRVAASATRAPATTANRPFGGANAARSAGWSPSGSLRQRRMFRQQQAAEDAERRRQEAADAAARQQEEAAQREEESAKRAAEREEMRANLLQVQEQLKKVREAKEAEKAEAAAEDNAEEE